MYKGVVNGHVNFINEYGNSNSHEQYIKYLKGLFYNQYYFHNQEIKLTTISTTTSLQAFWTPCSIERI